MAPPSVHPDTGERLKWDGLLLAPTSVEADHLLSAGRYYWAARLLAQHWPERGRHDLRLAVARLLLDTLGATAGWAARVG